MAGFDADFFVKVLVALLVVIDPPGVAVIFASLTKNATRVHRVSMALRGVAVAAVILVVFAIGGEWLLTNLGIGMPAFRTAGGILLFLIGLEMVFEKRNERRSEAAERAVEEQDPGLQHPEQEDISVFPLGIPLIAGPGAIATMVLFMGNADGVIGIASVFGALGAILLVTFLILIFATRLLNLMGESFTLVLARVMGILVCAISVQFVFDGVRSGVLAQAALPVTFAGG